MKSRSKDAGTKAGKRSKGTKSEGLRIKWYVDLVGLDDIPFAENVYIGDHAAASALVDRIAEAIATLVDCGMPERELGVRMGVYEVTKGGDA